MHLRLRFAFLAACAALLACSDALRFPGTTARTQRVYVLESVDGHPVPTVVYSGPIETYTAIDGELLLQTLDSAKEIRHARDSLPQYGTTVYLDTLQRSYIIYGDSIAVGFFGECRDICAPNRIGRYDDSTLTLTDQIYPPTNAVYQYRLVANSSR